MTLTVPLQRLAHHKDLPLPRYRTADSAGMDLHAALAAPCVLQPLQRRLVPTGLALALPAGFEAQVRPRSGWALKHGVTVLNSPGTIDADYRGEVKVLLINLGEAPVEIAHGDRIAQLVIAPIQQIVWQETPQLPDQGAGHRGSGGFGSTGFGSTDFGAGGEGNERI